MGKKLSDGYSGFMHLVERQMLFHDEIGKLIRKHEIREHPHPFRFITISRDIGALGEAVASELAHCLQWKVYDKEIVDHIARRNNVFNSLVNQFDEKNQSRFQDSIERLLLMFHSQGFSNDAYRLSLTQALTSLAERGQCIILGHGGAFSLQAHPGLHIRITASIPVRIQRLSRLWDMPQDQTERIVQKTDKDMADFIQHHFNSNRNSTEYFHLIFNTDKFSVHYIVAAILGVLEQSLYPVAQIPAPILNRISR